MSGVRNGEGFDAGKPAGLLGKFEVRKRGDTGNTIIPEVLSEVAPSAERLLIFTRVTDKEKGNGGSSRKGEEDHRKAPASLDRGMSCSTGKSTLEQEKSCEG